MCLNPWDLTVQGKAWEMRANGEELGTLHRCSTQWNPGKVRVIWLTLVTNNPGWNFPHTHEQLRTQ